MTIEVEGKKESPPMKGQANGERDTKKIIKNNRKIYQLYQKKIIQLLKSDDEMDLLLINDAIRMLSRLEVLCGRDNQREILPIFHSDKSVGSEMLSSR